MVYSTGNNKDDWASCPECGGSVRIDITGGVSPSISFDCRNCTARDNYWL